jgi:hypothetical protein
VTVYLRSVVSLPTPDEDKPGTPGGLPKDCKLYCPLRVLGARPGKYDTVVGYSLNKRLSGIRTSVEVSEKEKKNIAPTGIRTPDPPACSTFPFQFLHTNTE